MSSSSSWIDSGNLWLFGGFWYRFQWSGIWRSQRSLAFYTV